MTHKVTVLGYDLHKGRISVMCPVVPVYPDISGIDPVVSSIRKPLERVRSTLYIRILLVLSNPNSICQTMNAVI